MSTRRKFITFLSGAAAWPVAARAQQRERMRRVGVLLPATADDAHYQAWFGAFLQGLEPLGWTIGRNVQIDTRWATSNADAVRRHAAELVALAPDVILSPGASTVGPLLQVTRTVRSVARRPRGRWRRARSRATACVLANLAAEDPQTQARHAAFLQALQQLGWTVGRNVRIDYRWPAEPSPTLG